MDDSQILLTLMSAVTALEEYARHTHEGVARSFNTAQIERQITTMRELTAATKEGYSLCPTCGGAGMLMVG